jgi:hypothetical protein
MTMIDEEVLTIALNDVANSFEVTGEASDRILAEAQANEPPERTNHVPTFIGQPSRARTYLVAAALIVIVAGISVPLFRNEGTPNKTNSFGALGTNRSNQGATVHGNSLKTSTATGALAAPTSASASKLSVSGTRFKNGTTISSQKIESNGTIALTVSSGRVTSAFTTLTKLASSDGGFVDSTRAHVGTHASGKFSSGTIVLQVPQRNFAKLVAQVQLIGHATSVSTTSNVVTAQYVDLQAHITALEASREQYLTIMTKATTITGILAVQSQLNNLQSQIEQLQGQLHVLNNETTYGALTLTVSETGQQSHASHRSGLSKAWHDSVGGFVSGFEWLVRLAGPVLFVVLALGALLALAKFVRRSIRRRRI